MNLNFITNPDPNLQNKIRFFADYFLFANEYLGKLPELPFDNPYSLLAKIIFQIDNNSANYHNNIRNYFEQFFSFYDKNHPDIKALRTLFNKYNLQKPSKKKEWVKNTPAFISEIRRIHQEYKTKLFDENFETLFSFLKCPHSLTKHEKEIIFCTQILVSQFRLNGYSKQHVENAIDRIFSRDKFPFPPHITAIKDHDELIKAEQLFLEQRDFKEQFYGLKYLLTRHESQNGIFIYAIENCSIDAHLKDTFKIQLDKVTFISPTHQLLNGLRKFIDENDQKSYNRIKKGVLKDNTLLAYLTLNYDTLDFAKVTGLNIVTQELNQFNNYTNADLKVNTKHFLFTKDFSEIEGGSISFGNDHLSHIRKDNLETLEKNPYQTLRNVASNAKNQILHNESVFFKSLGNDSLSFYWHYIENTFWAIDINEPRTIQNKFSILLLNQLPKLKKDFFWQMNSLIFPFFGFDYKELGLEEDDIFISAGPNSKKMDPNFNILSFESKITSPFLKCLISYYKQFDSIPRHKKWIQYFESLIFELYNYRNSELHTGIVNEYSKIKLQSVLPTLVNKVRWDLIYGCKNNPNLSFQELIELISTKTVPNSVPKKIKNP